MNFEVKRNTLGGKEIKLGGDFTVRDMGGCFASSPSPSVSPSSNCILFLYQKSAIRSLSVLLYFHLQSYGGNLVTMLSNEDKRLIKHLRQKESLVHSGVLPSLWTISRRFLREVRKHQARYLVSCNTFKLLFPQMKLSSVLFWCQNIFLFKA